MFFKKQVIQTENKPEGYDYFSKMYFAKKAHEFCDELNTLHVLLTLGITKHYDCGAEWHKRLLSLYEENGETV